MKPSIILVLLPTGCFIFYVPRGYGSLERRLFRSGLFINLSCLHVNFVVKNSLALEALEKLRSFYHNDVFIANNFVDQVIVFLVDWMLVIIIIVVVNIIDYRLYRLLHIHIGSSSHKSITDSKQNLLPIKHFKKNVWYLIRYKLLYLESTQILINRKHLTAKPTFTHNKH